MQNTDILGRIRASLTERFGLEASQLPKMRAFAIWEWIPFMCWRSCLTWKPSWASASVI